MATPPVDDRLTVLIVDDEPVQLESLRRGLSLYGYDSVGADGAARAREILDGPGGKVIDILVSDLTMPGCSGYELVHAIRRTRPDLPVLAITGLACAPALAALRAAGVLVLQKPFDPEQLDRAIRQLVRA